MRDDEDELTKIVRKIIPILDSLAARRGLDPPTVYGVILFERPDELSLAELFKVTEDVLIGIHGVIAVKHTSVLPLLVERLALGYYALCLLKGSGKLEVGSAHRLAVNDLIMILSLLANSS